MTPSFRHHFHAMLDELLSALRERRPVDDFRVLSGAYRYALHEQRLDRREAN